MHLLIPFATALSEPAAQILRDQPLPHLQRLLARLAARREPSWPGVVVDEFSFTPPHERVLAEAFGWTGSDGRWPFAALHAVVDGITVGQDAWGELTPAHWIAGRDQVMLANPVELALDEAASRALLQAVSPLFIDEGFRVEWGSPMRWFIAHPMLTDLRTASPDRVIGRNIDAWLPYDPAARVLRRLQQEVQMLLYQHALHDERAARGLLPVNSFWLSGCGVGQPVPTTGLATTLVDGLRGPALAEDWTAWAEAWASLDAGPLVEAATRAEQGDPIRVTLCGERHWLRLEPPADGWWRTLQRRWQPPQPAQLLADL
jgi:hypothetical protein